jgi:hypothetical protein
VLPWRLTRVMSSRWVVLWFRISCYLQPVCNRGGRAGYIERSLRVLLWRLTKVMSSRWVGLWFKGFVVSAGVIWQSARTRYKKSLLVLLWGLTRVMLSKYRLG